MEILWLVLGFSLLLLAAGCFGMIRNSSFSAGDALVGLVLGLSLCLATFFLFILFAKLETLTAGSMVLLAILAGWFENELAKILFRIAAAAYGFNRKAPDK